MPLKNLVRLAGKPLLAYAIEAAVRSEVFDLVCVSSEADEILTVARTYGADLALKRPGELAGDAVQVKEVCRHVLERVAAQGKIYDEFGVILATNPLREWSDIRAAYQIFKRERANFCMSVVPYSHPPQRALRVVNGQIEPFLGLEYMRPAQSLETLYRHDGSIVFCRSEAFLNEGEFYGTNVVPYFSPQERSVDIDSGLDLAWAEFLLSHSPARGDSGVPRG